MRKGTVPIEGRSCLVRDIGSMAVISTDQRGLLEAKRIRKELLERKQRLDKLEGDVAELKEVNKEILTIVRKLLSEKGEI